MLRLRSSFLLPCLLLAACSGISPTLDFSRVQTEFENAFSSDLLFTGRISAAPADYHRVMHSLSTAGISKLDATQRPRAWMMRAVAEWRTGSLSNATASSASGLAASPPPHSREQVLLTMIPALVTDSQIITAWKAAGMAYTTEQYAPVESAYLGAMKSLAAAQAAMDSSTPASVRSFHAYHLWRVLFNWETIIDNLKGGSSVADQVIRNIRPHFDGRDLLDMADAARQSVPLGDPLRVIMDAEMGSHL
ncbi:MAG: hypothetical protein K9N47_26295 [Prosthecobacter sp.]|uniref:hypothetical protein n=1 Tax=Prosthecobacter sp. TaxID=1965333 RepID=UPI002635D926|nr:hypothetical protein [Prosthecobacter sp.]MCF7789662.1 hypothetical protein [Prosthecobacter sp.]